MTRKTQPIRLFWKVNAPIIWPLLNKDPTAHKIYWIMCSAMDRDTNKVSSKKAMAISMAEFSGMNHRMVQRKIQFLVEGKYITRLGKDRFQINPWGANAKTYLINNLYYSGPVPNPDPHFQDNLEAHFHIKTFADPQKKDYQTLDMSETEKDKRMDALEKQVEELKNEIALARSEATERHNILYSMLTPAKQEEAKSHMKLVAKDGNLV